MNDGHSHGEPGGDYTVIRTDSRPLAGLARQKLRDGAREWPVGCADNGYYLIL